MTTLRNQKSLWHKAYLRDNHLIMSSSDQFLVHTRTESEWFTGQIDNTVESPGVAPHMDLRMSYFSVSELMHESLQSFVSNVLSINIIIEAKDAKYHRLSIHEQNRR